MLINADVVKVIPEALYIAMIDSLRQNVCPRMRQAGRERIVSVFVSGLLSKFLG